MNILELSKTATLYYNILKSKRLAQGWEKYVVTDGKTCLFVKSDYEPQPGEAVFFLQTKNFNTMCQLYKSYDNE